MRTILLLALVTVPLASEAATFHVSSQAGSDVTGDGSAAAPWRTLGHALGQGLTEGDELLVAEGVHDRDLGESFPLVIPRGLTIRGSTSGSTVLRIDGAAPFPAEILQVAVGTAVLPSSSTIEHLVFEGPGAATVTTGVRFLPDRGAGPVLKSCRLSGFGRAVAMEVAENNGPDVRYDSRPFVDGNLILDNGVGIDISVSVIDTTGRVRERTEIINNVLRANGTAIHVRAFCSGCERSGIDVGNAILNNTVVRNTGDAILLENSDCSGDFATVSPQVQNNILAFNGGQAVASDACSVPNTVDTNLLWDNSPGGHGDPSLNVIADPLLVDLDGGDIHLTPASPCVDAGLVFEDVPDDYDGDLRPVDGDRDGNPLHDLGADELVPPSLALRRANFLSLAPVTPERSAVYPMFPSNPLTVLITADLAPGDTDAPGFLSETLVPMAFYQTDAAAPLLLCTKDRVVDSIRFDLR